MGQRMNHDQLGRKRLIHQDGPPTLTGPGRKVEFEVRREVTLSSKTDKDDDNILVEAVIHERVGSN